MQFIKFGFVGMSNTLISFAIYYGLIYLNVNYMVANAFGYSISSIWGYILNKKWVFNKNMEKTLPSIIKYYTIYGSSFLVNLVCMYIFVEILNISTIVAPILTMVITIPYNFILNKLWAFKE